MEDLLDNATTDSDRLTFEGSGPYNSVAKEFLTSSQQNNPICVEGSAIMIHNDPRAAVCHILNGRLNFDPQNIQDRTYSNILELREFIAHREDPLNGIFINISTQRNLSNGRSDQEKAQLTEYLLVSSIIFTRLHVDHIDSGTPSIEQLENFRQIMEAQGSYKNDFRDRVKQAYKYVITFYPDLVNVLTNQLEQLVEREMVEIISKKRENEIRKARKASKRNGFKGMRKRRR